MLQDLLKNVLSGIVWAAAMSLAVALLAVCLGLMNQAIVFVLEAVA